MASRIESAGNEGPKLTEAARAHLEELAATRIAIEAVAPRIDHGRFATKAVAGRPMAVAADIFADGHDKIDAVLLTRQAGRSGWDERPLRLVANDRWSGTVTFDVIGAHEFSILAWRDRFASWQGEVAKKHAAGVAIGLELTEGRTLVAETLRRSDRVSGADRAALVELQRALEAGIGDGEAFSLLMTGETTNLMRRAGLRSDVSLLDAPVPVWVDRERALVSSWYEIFPRSISFSMDRHGTFDDVIAHLPYVRDLGFDVLYFPPIHPIGTTNRKGRNNSLTAGPHDPGSPYAIGAAAGGHDAIHPELGTFDDFARLVVAAADHDMEIALDIALNASPDHPWIATHPDWFEWRPDGSIKHAENPPKKYEDIVNFSYYRDDGSANAPFWAAIRDMFLFWIGHGVKIFRVDNPHTKPLPFWEWIIDEVHAAHPDAIFLAEAFTRPKMMKRLAKVGYTQSYSYFTWRDTKDELAEYLTELTGGDMPAVMRPNFFVNTPDINPVYLQTSGRAGFQVRAVLAASLSTSWGLYNGFEICEAAPLPGKEEYLDSEKYQLRVRDLDQPGHIKDDIRRLNRLRREHPALRQFEGLAFYNAGNDNVLYYGKYTPDRSDFVLFAVNLDPHNPQGAPIEVPLWEFGLPDDATIEGRDLVTGADFAWDGKMQHVYLTPDDRPYAIWALKNPARTQADS